MGGMTLDQVRDWVIKGELLSAEEFAPLQSEWIAAGHDPVDGEGFIRRLAEDRRITEFQSAALLAGIPGPYMLGPYKVQAHLAAGRLGDVFRAVQVEFNQPVSLKIFPASLSRDPERVARLGREARVGVLVDNIHVVKTYQVGKFGEVPFIALEELQGETLEQRLHRLGPIPYAEACQLMSQAAEGLAYLHLQEVIHRDISPANLWITTQGLVKIMDFGAARDALSFLDTVGEGDAELTLGAVTSMPLGNYAYMSAEQAKSPESADVASDLYSLGCTLYHCLTGEVPFPDKNPIRQMLRHATEAVRPLSDFVSDIPAEVQAIVSRLLAKDAKARYSSAGDAAGDLTAIHPHPMEFSVEPVSPDFMSWLESGAKLDEVTEVQYEPEFQQFVDWVSTDKLPQF
jgi:serine/threonine protein kinase